MLLPSRWVRGPYARMIRFRVTGAGTALLGKEGAMACTIAVEELIGRHYNDQIKQLIDDDPEVHKDLLQVSRKRLSSKTRDLT